MQMGHPTTSADKLGEGTKALIKKFGVQGKLYWRGFLQCYERSYKNDRKNMGKELTRRGLMDKSKSESLPLPLYQFLLYNYQYYTVDEGKFTARTLKDFMQVGFPTAGSERLAKGSKKAIQKYGEEDENSETKTTLNWDGFLKLYEDSYRKNPGDLKVEFENRGFTLHRMDAPLKQRRSSRQLSRTNLNHLTGAVEAGDGSPRGSQRLSFKASQPAYDLKSPGRLEIAPPTGPVTGGGAATNNNDRQKVKVPEKKEPPKKKPSGCCVVM